MYGLDQPHTASYGMRCLLARRLVESGVRFVQVLQPRNQPWDTHSDTKGKLPEIARQVDLPSAGLVRDLQQRGLLDDALVVWGGEFGRLPVSHATMLHLLGLDHWQLTWPHLGRDDTLTDPPVTNAEVIDGILA